MESTAAQSLDAAARNHTQLQTAMSEQLAAQRTEITNLTDANKTLTASSAALTRKGTELKIEADALREVTIAFTLLRPTHSAIHSE